MQSDRIRRMEFLFPLSMLGVGLVIGAVSLWFINRREKNTNSSEPRGRNHRTRYAGGTTLGQGRSSQQLREALDREAANTEELRTRELTHVATVSTPNTARRRAPRKPGKTRAADRTLKRNLPTRLKHSPRTRSRNNNQSFIDLARQNLEKFQETAKGDLERRQTRSTSWSNR